MGELLEKKGTSILHFPKTIEKKTHKNNAIINASLNLRFYASVTELFHHHLKYGVINFDFHQIIYTDFEIIIHSALKAFYTHQCRALKKPPPQTSLEYTLIHTFSVFESICVTLFRSFQFVKKSEFNGAIWAHAIRIPPTEQKDSISKVD